MPGCKQRFGGGGSDVSGATCDKDIHMLIFSAGMEAPRRRRGLGARRPVPYEGAAPNSNPIYGRAVIVSVTHSPSRSSSEHRVTVVRSLWPVGSVVNAGELRIATLSGSNVDLLFELLQS